MIQFVSNPTAREDAQISEKQVDVLRWSIVHIQFMDVLILLDFDDRLDIVLAKREVLHEFEALAENVHRLLEVLRDQGHAICSDLVDDASVGHHGFAAHTNEVNF